MKRLGNKIRKKRVANMMSIEQLSKEYNKAFKPLKLCASSISYIENGKMMPKADQLVNLGKLLGEDFVKELP